MRTRRDFITLLGGGAAWPLAARAQQPDRLRRIGVLMGSAEGDPQAKTNLAIFTRTLRQQGWEEGRNIRIEYRWAASDAEQMRAFAKELVALQPDLIVGHTTQVTAALQRETRTIPIVFVVVSDPVGSGFVASLPRPGGNITGFINIESSLGSKWVELLREIVPGISRIALMFNPDTAPYSNYYLRPFEAAARSFAVEPIAAPVRAAADIERVISELGTARSAGLVVMPDIFPAVHRGLIIALAGKQRLPTLYSFRFFVADGGLISYGIDNADLFRRAPIYVDRILKGAKPADLPVELPTKFELAINLKTAKALGLTVPATLLARADEVIE
jgi:ABC-type uncharacterized transport system substrate-binding protein